MVFGVDVYGYVFDLLYALFSWLELISYGDAFISFFEFYPLNLFFLAFIFLGFLCVFLFFVFLPLRLFKLFFNWG